MEPTATDNVGGDIICYKTHDPGISFPIGSTQVTYYCPDQVGNDATCTFAVTGNYIIAVLMCLIYV